MPYRPPGTYARFVRNVSPVVNAGNSRIMAIAGTGINYYTVENEAITKSKTKPYDMLQNENVFEVLSVSSRPIYNGLITSNNTIYYPSTESQKGYKMKDNVISWDSLVDADITMDYKQCPDLYFNGTTYNIEYSVDETALYPVEDGNWIIEVSYINEDDIDNDPKLGCYRIINADTSEIIGEYVVSDKAVTNEDGTYPIPGVKLVVKNTLIFNDDKQSVFVGDYVTLHTVGAKTETEATAYKYNLTAEQTIDDFTASVIIGDGDDDSDNKSVMVHINPYKLSDKFKIYLKTSEFEGLTNDTFTTEDLSKVYSVSLNGKNEYTFNETELNNITGLTTLKEKTYKVGVKFTTRKPTQREINNKTFDYNDVPTSERMVMDMTFSWTTFEGNKTHILQGANNSPTSFTKATYTVAIGSFQMDETTQDIKADSFKETEAFTNLLHQDATTVKPETPVLMVYSYKADDLGNTKYYDKYEAAFNIMSDFITATDGDITKVKSVEDFTNGTITLTYDESENNISSVYNSETKFYALVCALDENNNVLDYTPGYDTRTSFVNIISTNGTQLSMGNNVIDNNDEDYTGTITSLDKDINKILSMATKPGAAVSDDGNGLFYSAISGLTIISNEQLYETSAIYKVQIITAADGKDYFRIVRYVNGKEDTKFTDYNGAVTDSTWDGDIDNLNTSKLYEIPPDGDIFDIIPGVMFDYDVTMSASIPNKSSTLIITSPRIINEAIPPEGSTYYISYKYRKSDADYEPKFFDDYDSIVAEYGNYDVSASSAVLNSLSLGAEIAFNNGVSQIVCVQARNNSDYEMQTAIDRLQKSIAGAPNVATVVPLSVSDAVGAYLNNHVSLMSSYDYAKERMGYLGARIGQKINKLATKADRSLGMTSVAEGYDNERIVYVVPGAIKKQIRDLRTGRYNERTLPGCYAAVAVAAIGLANDPAEPLTYKTISGFTQLVDLYSEQEKNQLAGSGCCVLEQSGNTIRIRHGITTCDDDVNAQEITLIQIKDYVIDACRTITADTFIGRKLTQSLIADIQYTMESLLNNFISQSVIINFSSLKVKRSPLDPRQVDVSFEIEAVYPLNWINIEFGFSAVS